MPRKLAAAVLKVADEPLQSALRLPAPLRAVVVFSTPALPPIQVAPQATPLATRTALISEQRKQLGEAFAGTIEKFKELGLVVHGGGATRAVVLEGLPERISQALALPGIAQAMLDRPIELELPTPVRTNTPGDAPASASLKKSAKPETSAGSRLSAGTPKPARTAKRAAPKRK